MFQDIIYEELLMCNKVGHENQRIISLCICPQCDKQRTCCNACVLQDHPKHKDFVKELSDIKNQYRSQVQPFKLVQQLRISVNELLNQIDIQLSKLPLYPFEVNLTNLNFFANQLASSGRDHMLDLKDSLAQSTKIIEATLNRVLNSIKQDDKEKLEKRKAEAEKIRIQGDALEEQEKLEEAIQLYNQSIDVYDQNDNCWCNKGYALSQLGKYEEAIECYDQAILIQPKDHINYTNKASSLNYLNRYDEALVQANKAIELNPNFKYSWNEKGRALLGLSRNQEALEGFKKADEIEPKDHIILGNLALALERLGQKKEALKYYKEALKYNSNHQFSLDGLKRLAQQGIK